jgi:hypothetical protein
VSQDVDKASERVADIEASDAPRLVRRTILDFQPGFLGALLDFFEVVDFDREIRNSRSRTSFAGNADLRPAIYRRRSK